MNNAKALKATLMKNIRHQWNDNISSFLMFSKFW